jgi:hypothetical protein
LEGELGLKKLEGVLELIWAVIQLLGYLAILSLAGVLIWWFGPMIFWIFWTLGGFILLYLGMLLLIPVGVAWNALTFLF